MTDLSHRLAALTPEQRRLLGRRLQNRTAREPAGAAAAGVPERQSLYFFASADAVSAPEYYRFVLDAARQADTAGLHAVWLPERHFVDFGGHSPNPAVLAAAVAVQTERVQIRAGSVAAPLHHPARIAEDWSVVDNLSGGRAGISFASGWHPDDFVLARTDYAQRRETTLRIIDQVRAHWRGEKVSHPTTAGGTAAVRTGPAPVRRDMPVWLTSAGNSATFASAARAGLGVMTALLGQTMPQLRENIAHYREEWRRAGHPGDGDVVVMVHAYVSERADLEDFLRPAMHGYLRAYRSQTTAPGEDETLLLESAYLNYLAGPSLLGPAAKAAAVLGQLREAGADEVGFLVDFGLPTTEVLAALPALFACVPAERDR
ncbi:MupA/Atu3671 family FMN-dependent luciferase-like monooxygenase [Streptomyces sp. IBSBF 2806]|uniref:MupA/Atu3671 family FMN-dependent luciferase-like monooxygenase n=1 Tax=Streptomyces sp. IBSBF 2806 TaxID=2903529 RepID=UPI002FDC13E2